MHALQASILLLSPNHVFARVTTFQRAECEGTCFFQCVCTKRARLALNALSSNIESASVKIDKQKLGNKRPVMLGHIDCPNLAFAMRGTTGSKIPLGNVVSAAQITSILKRVTVQLMPHSKS